MTNRESGNEGAVPVDAVVWVCLAAAVLGTLYFLMREPEDPVREALSHTLVQVRVVALAASVLGAVLGVCRILLVAAEDTNLFGMAVLFNIIVGCFWVLRLALPGPGAGVP